MHDIFNEFVVPMALVSLVFGLITFWPFGN